MLNLQGKIALVTGSSKGLGKGIALVLAKQGAEVIINYPPSEDDGEVVQQINAHGGRAINIAADVSNAKSVNEMFDEIGKQYGRLDILVNNAGISESKDIFEIEDSSWNNIINTNLSSGFYCSRRAMLLMKKQHYGRIVFISSMVAYQGALFGHVHYAASKSGQLGMVKTLARTGAGLGITVNAVVPGIIETELLFETHGSPGVEALAKTVPLGLGKPEDVGAAVAFLCSDEAHYITGACIDVNGGMNMR